MHQPHDAGAGTGQRRSLVLLACGTLVGVVAAAAGLLSANEVVSSELPADAAARVNGKIVERAYYERLLHALASDTRTPIGDEQRRFVIDRLIEEELLIQRGLDLGLAHHDARVRKDLSRAMVDSVVAEYGDLEASDAELRTFFAENEGFFARTGRYRVRQIWVSVPNLAAGDDAFDRAREAAERLRTGEPFAEVHARLGDTPISPVPDALLPPAKLVDYLGPTALRTVLELEPGQTSEPIRSSTGYHVLQLLERGATQVPGFEAVRQQVLAEFQRRKANEALRAYLDDLRARADVEIAADLVAAEDSP